MPRRANKTSYGQKDGNDPRLGKPGPGRHPKSLVLFLKRLRQSAKAQLALQAAAEDPDSRNFATAWRYLAEYDDDKPAEKRELSGKVEISVKMTREGPRRTSG